MNRIVNSYLYLQVYVKAGDTESVVWMNNGSHGDKWHEAEVFVSNQPTRYQVRRVSKFIMGCITDK